MPFTGQIHEATQFSLRGSLTSETFPTLTPFVDIVVNRRFVARVAAREFSFNPFEALAPGTNIVELFIAGSDQLLQGGSQTISGDLPADVFEARESDAPIDCFMDEVTVLAEAELRGRVWAIGEKTVKAVLDRGSECERERTEENDFDLVLAANVCEHWFPSIAKELVHIYNALRPGGLVCLDFPREDPGLTVSRGVYKPGKAFYRVYSEPELRSFLLDAGLEVIGIVMCENERVVVSARKPEVTF